MKTKVGISDTGMAMAVITVERQSRRNRNTTSAASSMPSSNVCQRGDEAGAGLVHPRQDLGDRDAFVLLQQLFDGRRTPSSVVTSLASLILLTWKPTTGWPLSSAKRAHLGGAVTDVGDIGEPHEAPAAGRDGEVANLLDRDRGAENAQRLFATADGDAATRRIETGDRQRLVHLCGGQPLRGHALGIDQRR